MPPPDPIQPPQSPTPAGGPPAGLRALDDFDAARDSIYSSVFDAAANLPPVSNAKHTLSLTKVKWADPGKFTKKQRKEAVLTGGTLGRRLKGTWELTDNATGDVLDRREQVLMRVPHLTEGGTFVHNGTEHALVNQQRLRPGVFTRTKDNGDLESHVNVLSGGPSHRIQLDPAKGVFNVHVGQADVPLLPLLRHLGAGEPEIREAWGDDLYARNYAKSGGDITPRVAEKFMNGKLPEGVPAGEAIRQAFAKMGLDPEVTRRTLGHPYENLNKDTYLAATKKLLAVSRGESPPDDRDHLAYQQFLGPEDLFAERLAKDRAGVRRQLLYKATWKGHLRDMPSSPLQRQIDSAIMESGLGRVLEEVNPLEVLDKNTQVTRMGEGGIPSTDSIPDESRAVQPSQYGFVDPLRTPESLHAGVDVYLANNVRKGPGRTLYSRFIDRGGREVWKTPREVADDVVGFPGAMSLPGKRVPAMKGGRLTWAKKEEVAYTPPAFEHAFSPLNNLVPFKSMLKGQRASMASRMITQALPLAGGEAPLVQNAVPGTNGARSYDEEYGRHAGAVHAPRAGHVLSVSPDGIKVRYDDGETADVDLHNEFPNNRKTRLHQTALVEPDQRFAAGHLLAGSNYTDAAGSAALGVNARTAYVSHGGKNYEDAISVSESMARRLSSDHAYQHQLEVHDRTRTGRNAYVSLFPAKYSRAALAGVDERGLVRPGTTVNYGDPLILAAEERGGARNKVHRKGTPAFNDVSLTWDHHDPGVVTDVVQGRGGPVVVVKSTHPAQVGDKISGRHGNKGIIGAIHPDDQMPHGPDGRPYEVLLNPLGLISRVNSSQVAEVLMGKVAEKTGRPVKVEDFDPAVPDRAEWVLNQLRQHGLNDTEDLIDPVRGTKIPGVLAGNAYFMKLHHTSESKGQGRSGGAYTSDDEPAKGGEHGAKRNALLNVNALLSHGACFMGSVNVMTEDGPLEISKIVKQRLSVRVLCADPETGEFTYRPVVDWLCRCVPPEELLRVTTSSKARGTEQRSHYRAIRCTRGHEFYTPEGKVQAYYLKPGDWVLSPGTRVAPWQEQMMIGSLMGDGYIGGRPDGEASGLAMCHGHSQWAYLNWKYDKLTNLGISRPKRQRVSVGGFAKHPTARFTLRQHASTDRLHAEFYAGNTKSPPAGIVRRMGWYGLAIWFADDGGCVCPKSTGTISSFRLHTCAFPVEAVDRLASELREFTGLPWRRILQNGKYPILTLTNGDGTHNNKGTDNIRRFTEQLQPYLPPSVAYKLRLPSARCGSAWDGLAVPTGVWTEPVQVKSIEPYRPAPHEDCLVYNITVAEHHNYVVHGVLVGNTDVLRDINSVRGQRNDDWWLQFMSGHTPATPKVPLVYRKFVNELKAAGVNVVRDGPRTHVMALTDKDVDRLAEGRELQNAETVRFDKDLKPIPGGLFDPAITGSHHGTLWSALPLSEPMPSPVMEDPIRRTLGLTQKKFQAVLRGDEQLPGGQTGPGGIAAALKAVDLGREIAVTRAAVIGGNKGERDSAVRRLGYLKSAQRLGLHPGDWVLNKAPVLPPQFRPVNVMTSGAPLVADANLLYRELFEANKNLSDMKAAAGDSAVGDERMALYHAFKAVTGLGEPVTEANRERQVKGILKAVLGSSPKHSTVQRKLLGSTVDSVGRGVISPDPDLDMDSIGIPEDRAFDVYERFVVRRLKRSGMPVVQAMKNVRDKTPLARKAMLEEMEQRPVIMDRAPVLHRFGIMAFRPRLTKGSVVKLSPLIYKGFGADNDGDTVNWHVPTSDDARQEALDVMLPSRQLLSPADFKTPVHAPTQEYVAGSFAATSSLLANKRPARHFRSVADLRAAWRAGDVAVNDPAVVLGRAIEAARR